MRPCWILLVTRGLRVWLPPEVYLVRELALLEASRWKSALRLSGRTPAYSDQARALHLLQSRFPESWRACPVRVGVEWSVRSHPKLKVELIAADEQEGLEWLRRHVPRSVEIAGREQVEYERRGVRVGASVLRVKRVMGF